MSEKPRVGVLAEETLCQWQIEALNRMTDTGAQIERVIVNKGEDSRLLYNLRNAPAYLFIAGGRELAVRFLGKHAYLDRVPVSNIELLDNSSRIDCNPVPRSDLGQELPNDVVEKYCSDLDILVRFGFGILKGDVLDAPTYGVFSYHHGDIRKYRGRPAGFWEFLNDEGGIGVTLQQLTDELDKGRVIQIEEFPIAPSDTYQEILQTAYSGSTGMLASAVESIHDGTFSPSEPDVLGELYTAPEWTDLLRYFWKNTRNRFRSFLL